MVATRQCSICGACDSWCHSLLECTMARYVWAMMDENITEHMNNTHDPSAKHWLFAMIESLPHADLIKMSVTMWAIWHAKRKAIHEDVYQSPLSTYAFIEDFLAQL